MIHGLRCVACIILSSVANLFNLGAAVILWLAWKASPSELGLRNPLKGD